MTYLPVNTDDLANMSNIRVNVNSDDDYVQNTDYNDNFKSSNENYDDNEVENNENMSNKCNSGKYDECLNKSYWNPKRNPTIKIYNIVSFQSNQI
ncbi:hypothetical protein HHI36_014801 [Cryptolaemus montrouzieri]|uniref:Uncharacterized protein n=1 Tax=Cryptolaemus montrouzieri TaxID=559131 RepID=A0ABD2N418_9CUCU